MSDAIPHQLEKLAAELMSKKRVAFSFTPTGQSECKGLVLVRECEEYDFLEYGEEFKLGEMFEIGPAKPQAEIVHTELRFSSVQEAGNAVLKRRAELLGEVWGDA